MCVNLRHCQALTRLLNTLKGEQTLTHHRIWKLESGEPLDHQTSNNQRCSTRCSIFMVFLVCTVLGVRTILGDQNGRLGVADTLSTMVEKRD